ncbi:DUF6261 family protein [Saccharicrinis aurantiacus]|uniref:DUF6261 family protein n=1 Tax=Saccharicrinis aurantiacus TaxID=1849719 RepID=UPI00094F6E7A|nr:DUF6261 family protein [Saccharicrinis aurantiacus]
MKKIQKAISHMRNSEVAGLTQEILLDFSDDLLAADGRLNRIVASIQMRLGKLIEAISRNKAESELEELDNKRDKLYSSIRNMVSAYQMHPDQGIANAAKQVDAIIDNYGSELNNLGFSAQSAQLKSYFADFKKPEISASIAMLPTVGDMVTALETQEDEFITSQHNYKDAINKVEQNSNASALKKELVAELNNKLIPYLRLVQAMDDADFMEPCEKIANKVSAANNVVKQRSIKLN